MKDQHTKIKGYRDLTQDEIDMMNQIKEKGQELLDLHAKLLAGLNSTEAALRITGNEEESLRFAAAEPKRWAAIGKTHIQEGISALVRAVAQPTSC